MALTTIDDRGLKTPIDLLDNEKIRFGTGNDVEIYHDGTNSFITNSINDLTINSTGDDLILKAADDAVIQVQGSENAILCNGDGAVELYYDGTKKLETASFGLRASDSIYCDEHILIDNDTGILKLGTGADLQIFHDGSNSYLQHAGGGGLIIKTNGGVDEDITIQAKDAIFLKPNDGDAGVYLAAGGSVELYYDDVIKAKTTSAGIQVFGNYVCSDDNKLLLGNDEDLQIYYDGSHSYIQNGTNNLYIRATTTETGISVIPNGAVKLFYDNSSKLETQATGARIYGITTSETDAAGNWSIFCKNDGNNADRYGFYIKCGADDAAGTNYAVGINDGDGDAQGYITFSGGTVTYGAFTAHHPCIVPDADNPSDSSNAYPYGTLLETISIEYTQKNGSDTERGIRYKVQKTQSANSKKVLGAYGSSMNGGPDGQTNEHQTLILGDGHILVNNAGGNIEVGDGICSSSTTGIGQKATVNPSMIIGIAQEAITFTGSETKLVAVQYGLQQFIPWT